jgi:diguanylate cyclase (GGDEF)-like protein
VRYATALSLLLIGVDRLKQHNDEWGPVAGDVILREVARRLASRLRRTERLARTGGDEFAILVPQYRREALALAEQLRSVIVEAPFHLPGHGGLVSVRVTVSIGVAEASDIDAARELLAAAEEALHAAKERGRDRIQSFRTETTIGALRATTGQRGRRDPLPPITME